MHVDSLGLPPRHPLVPGRRHQRRRAADGRHHGGREHLLAAARRPAHGIREPAALQRPEHVLGHHPGLQQHQRLRSLQGRRSHYDPATGLGSPKADALATALATFTPAAVNPDATNLVVTSPTATRTVKYGRQVTLAGTLTDSSDTPIANRRVYVELREGNRIYLYGDQTDSSGVWSFALTSQLRRNLSWQAIFPGSDTQQGLTVAGTTIHVIPRLGSKASRTSVPRGTSFSFGGKSAPNMHGARVRLQVRRKTSGAWRTIATVAVNRHGGYSRKIHFTTPGAAYLRWSYAGGASHAWMSATSRSRRVAIT